MLQLVVVKFVLNSGSGAAGSGTLTLNAREVLDALCTDICFF
jgi:hypothetical protein